MQSRSSTIIRTQHLRHIREALTDHTIVYLGGFFGSGKTTLMTQYAAMQGSPCLHLSCADERCLQALDRLPADVELVLIDDLQELTDQQSQSHLAALLLHQCALHQFLLAGWEPMPGWLKPLYASGHLTMLGQDFLAFTPEETDQFLKDRGIFSDKPLLDFIAEKGQGWLLALSLYTVRLGENPGVSIDELEILMVQDLRDCFEHVIYVTLDEVSRALLCHLSPFPEFTSAMARFVSGNRQADTLLTQLSQRCGFIIFTPPDRFALAPRFRQFLFRRMTETCPEDFLTQQYNNAGLYYALEGNLPEALHAYQQAGNLDKITELLISNARNRPGSGHYLDLQSYYEMLPEQTLLSSPELMKGMSLLHSLSMNVAESEHWYQELKDFAARTPRRDPQKRAAQEALIYLDIALPHRGIAHMPALLRSATALLTSSNKALNETNVAGNCPSLLNGGKDFCMWLKPMRMMYRMLAPTVEAALGICGVGVADIGLGEGIFETTTGEDYTEALSYLTKGLTAAEAHGDPEIHFAGVGVLCRMHVAQGNLTAARELLTHFISRLPDNSAVRLRLNAEVLSIRLDLLEGVTLAPKQWMDGRAPNELDRFITLERYRYLAKVRLYIIRGDWLLALALLGRLQTFYDMCSRPYGQAETELLTAIVCRRSHQGDWQAHFRAALAICEKFSLVRCLANEGIAICDMASEVFSPESPWQTAVLAKIKQQARLYPRYLQPLSGGKETLTDTEHTVYQLLIAGKRNEEIASVLGVTLRTVKFHISNIYRKLNVQSRAQAIKRAAELGDL